MDLMNPPALPSPLQERFRFLAEVAPGVPVANLGLLLQVDRPLSAGTAERALAAVAARHPGLRPALEQVAADDLEVAHRLAQEHVDAPFELDGSVRLRALQASLPGSSLVVLAAHRSALDHRSLALVGRELAAICAGVDLEPGGGLLGTGAPLELRPERQTDLRRPGTSDLRGWLLRSSYPALEGAPSGPRRRPWTRGTWTTNLSPAFPARPLDSADLAAAVEALRRELAGASPDVELPLRGPRPAVPAHRGGRVPFSVPAEVAGRAVRLAAREGIPPAAVHVAALQALLHRCSRQEDVLLGVELDRRPGPDAAGAFADLALLRSGPRPAATFRVLARAAAERLAAAAARPPVPPSAAAAALGQRLGPSLPAPCRVAFALRPGPGTPPPGWTVRPLPPGAAEFDLELVLTEAAEGEEVPAELVHDLDVLSPETAAALAGGWVRILASALAGPDRHRSLLAVLSPAEEGRLLGEWNAFPDLAPAELPVHRLVERHAAARPGALALSRGSERLTYGELNRRANQLGRLLRERAGVAEAVVAVCMDRSSEWLVTVLAAFKAGAVPVLLDPRAPRRRHELALAGARPRLVLGLERLGVDLPCDPDQVVLVDREWPEIDRRDAGNLDVPVELDSLAYLVQTSGSTGVPKAVGVPHRALAHCSVQQAAVYGIRPDDRSTWFAPPGASVSIIEIWPYLGAGASLHIAEPEVVASPPALRDWLLGEQITQTFVIAPVAEILCALDWPAACPLRLMTVAGEKVRRWPPAALPFEVAVTYGSAEASYIASCLHPRARRCTSATATAEERRTPPPIGRPWPGARVHVVDADLSLMPPGAVGELAVDSPELARGYLGDPAKTAVKFVPNPFAGAPGSRLYLTGDLASWRPDGLLDHRGRVDTMVKIRGFRIEVAEVEAALLADPGVAAAVVAAVPDPRGESRLVAYVVPGGLVTAAELRGFVAERLPEPMVPAAYVFLSELPLNTTGKVDRLSLPAPDWDAVAERPPYRAPRDELERALAALWGEVLSVGDPGLDDDFFQLGGDSLRASRVAIALEERLGVRLSLRDLFVARTPAALAERLRAAASSSRAR